MHIYYLLSTGISHSKSESYRTKIMEVRTKQSICNIRKCKYRPTPVFVGNTFQDLLRLCETVDNTERCM
jgi:hypothetical protein